ncbi:MAG TPA: alpha/beta fold hydrolase [Gemmatimonadales bacterium]|nr:alpha/beta fold hydrolase [Gemmatimonadales bacterium]
MATPILTRHRIPGALGEILIDVRAGNRRDAGPAVVLCHGFKGFKDWGFFPPFADRLARAGYVVVSWNASGSGVDDSGEFVWPDRFGRNTFSAELADLESVLGAVDGGSLDIVPPTTIGLVGHSRGGGLAILAASRSERIASLVTWASISTSSRWSPEMQRRWREAGFLEITNQRTGQAIRLLPDVLDDLERNAKLLDIGSAADRIRCPWLVIHGAVDETVKLKEAEELTSRASRPGSRVVRGTGHTFGAVHPFQGMTPALTEVFDATVDFLGKSLS